MAPPIVQIYEIQTPQEACTLIETGVAHIGSVILSREQCHDPILHETVATVKRLGAVSSLIPLFTEPDAVFDVLRHYGPHIVHFCDNLDHSNDAAVSAACDLQKDVKRLFPEVRIMRSIPIGQDGQADGQSVLDLAARLQPVSDYFLTDTLIAGASGTTDAVQPVDGFVGITGLTCDWSVAAQLVSSSRIPVILAGGISPDNVVRAIRQVRPYGVDSCTCTNAVDDKGRPIRFRKDLDKVKKLISEVRRACA